MKFPSLRKLCFESQRRDQLSPMPVPFAHVQYKPAGTEAVQFTENFRVDARVFAMIAAFMALFPVLGVTVLVMQLSDPAVHIASPTTIKSVLITTLAFCVEAFLILCFLGVRNTTRTLALSAPLMQAGIRVDSPITAIRESLVVPISHAHMHWHAIESLPRSMPFRGYALVVWLPRPNATRERFALCITKTLDELAAYRATLPPLLAAIDHGEGEPLHMRVLR